MEHLPSLQRVEFIQLSEDIPHTSYSKLCNALGYSYDWYQTIIANHRGNYNEAMTEILIKWNTKQTDTSRSRSILARKLHDVELGGLGKALSKGEYLLKQQENPQEAFLLPGIPGEYLPKQQEDPQEAIPLQLSSDIYSKKISESLNVQQCREKLENKYRNQLCKISMKPWDHNDYAEFKDMHTVVTMVQKDALGKDTQKKEVLRDSVAGIFSTKVNGKLPARILISAPAGRGKTTAVAKMAYDWVHGEKGSGLEHLPLLFVVKFRNTSQLTSIGEAIKSQLLSDVDDLTPEGVESFIRENQGICHIILDGLDEYAGISSSNQSLGSNIVSVIRWEEFPESRVLVTTRPHLENFFNQDDLPRVYTKMWIEGFSQESSREYIDKFFASASSPDSGIVLKVYLDEQPLINELVKTPLFCVMICHLWSEGLLDTDTTTQTELLERVNVVLMHYANKRLESRVKITPKKLKETIHQLGKVALTGLLDGGKKRVFTPHDFHKVPATLDMAYELGIVSKTTWIRLSQSKEITSTTIEFYHKLAQEHSAGKFLADQTHPFSFCFLKISKLDRVMGEIKANIGDYENVIRFAAGTDSSLCIQILKALLKNSFLDESERYRILLDCSSETTGTKRNVSSLVQRCVNAKSIVLKSPTVYTVFGIQNLPNQLKLEVEAVKLEGSTMATDLTSELWSCLGSFSMLHTLTISDSSLSFPSSPPELPSVTKLSAERVTSHSYEGLLSSLPGLSDIDITIDDAERDIPQITAGLRRTGGQQLTRIELTAPPSLPSEKNRVSRETMRGLGLLIREHTKKLQLLGLSGVKSMDEGDFVEFVESSTHMSIDYESSNYDRQSDVQVHLPVSKFLYFTRCEHEKKLEDFAKRKDEVLPESGTTGTSPGKTVSVSPRPSSSTSVAIPLQDSAAAADEVSTPRARALSVDDQHEDEDGSSATGNFGARGGQLSSKSHGLTLHIPPGALVEDQKISLRVLTEIPNGLTLKDDEILVSHGFQCYPSGLRFKKPVKLTIPHCAIVTAPNKVQTVLYSCNQPGTPKRIPQPVDITCSVKERCLEVFMSHFCCWFIAVISDAVTLKGILLSCMPFLPRALPSSREPVLEVRLVKMPHGQNWKDVHELTEFGYQPVKDDDDCVVFRRATLLVSCQLGRKSREIWDLQHEDLRVKPKETLYFTLDLNGESDEMLVSLNLTQTRTQRIKFNTRFQGTTASPRPSASTSDPVDITPHDASAAAAADKVFTSTTRKVSHAMINKLARHIPSYSYYAFSGKLGIEQNQAKNIVDKYDRDYEEATRDCMTKWMNRSTRSVADLHDVLKEVELAGLIGYCKNDNNNMKEI